VATGFLDLGRIFLLHTFLEFGLFPGLERRLHRDAVVMLEILLVDHNSECRLPSRDALRKAGHNVTAACNGAEAAAMISSQLFDVMICDIRLPKIDGLTLFRRVKLESPSTEVILTADHPEVSEAVAALKEGATDYLTKPFDFDELTLQVDRIEKQRSMRRDLNRARAELSSTSTSSCAIVGRSPPILRLMRLIDTIAQSNAPVLITGESGTGKELVARALHERSPRRAKPFVAVNCAAYPAALLEAELFGHERGAFTGAVKRREGRFRAAEGGTLMLDEIAEIPAAAQAKLLRVLQEGTIEPLGTNESVKVNVRIISATHRNLSERITDGRFREDLFYRLDVLEIEIPPLRDRRGDLPFLLHHFLQKYSPPGSPPPTVSPRAWAILSRYPFPGNVREFSHAIEHAVVLAAGDEIRPEHLPSDLQHTGTESGDREAEESSVAVAEPVRNLDTAMKAFEREYLLRALEHVGGSRVPGPIAQKPVAEAA